ncbi:MAG TPA: hypothetical protein VE967_19905 [Gemmatimonadaceae bacterium]|nr:hypothetical protein [Gemmatimonadaceae bacterium]
MTIPALTNTLVPLRTDTREAQPGVQPSGQPRAHLPAQPAAPARAESRARAGSLPVDAPAGTDPELWSILTSEERAFFARSATSGPLTYSKVARAQAPSTPVHTARGGRVDIKV